MTDEKSITVERSIDASTKAIFDVLSNPARHAELDGSGFVISDDRSKPDHRQRRGLPDEHDRGPHGWRLPDRQHRHRLRRQPPAGLADRTGRHRPARLEWVWELEADGSDQTLVSLTYDWSKVTDPDLLKQISFPLVDEAALEDSLDHLAAAVAG